MVDKEIVTESDASFLKNPQFCFDIMENIYAERIKSLRSLMRENGWDAVIVTGSDPHGSEYPAERWKQVQWLTGFTGEAGDVVVTADHAGLWTDTRYFIQAVEQLDGTGVKLHKTRIPGQVLIPEWLAGQFADADSVVIAVDGLSISASFVCDQLKGSLDDARIENFIQSRPDLLESLWEGRPGIPQTPIFTVETGESREDKLAWLRDWMKDNSYDAVLVSGLDEIAWLLNVRASDIEYTPLCISYLLVTEEEVLWFVLKDRIEDSETERTLDEMQGIRLMRYDEVEEALANYGHLRLFVDDGTINYELFQALAAGDLLMERGESPVKLRKAVKNDFEIEGMKKAHVIDGIAMEKFLFWLEKSIAADRVVNEWDAAVRLGRYRAEDDAYMGDSFETISAYGKGAALPHYITPKTDAPELRPEGLYLCDSGGQYQFGTTDITRTVPLGPCTELEATDYTLVLKGHIDLAMAVFPEGTAGCQIDALAREPLWRFGRNFGHGTGHGIGFFLGVHEGPVDIRQNFNRQALLPGMITSDEPGIYREGEFGIRHENLLLCVSDWENEFGRWLRFETLTLCHFDTSVLRTELLDDNEIAWLNEYNSRVFETLSPLLPADVVDWLRVKTEPICRR